MQTETPQGETSQSETLQGDTLPSDTSQGDTSQGDTSQGDTSQPHTSQTGTSNSTGDGKRPKARAHSEADTHWPMSVMARSEWTARRVVLGTLTIIGVATVFLLIYRLYMVIFLLFAAIALQVALSPVVEWLHRRRVPRGVSVLSLYATLFLIFAGLLWLGLPTLVEQTTIVLRDMPGYYQTGRESLTEAPVALVRRLGRLVPEQPSFPLLMELAENGGENGAETTPGAPNPSLVWIGARTIFAILAIFVLAYYWTLEGNTIIRRLVLKAPAGQRAELRALIGEFEAKIGAYFRGTAVLSLIVGVASTLAFLALGIPNAILLGIIMGVTEAIPVIGPILGAIPALLLTLATAPDKALWVLGAMLLIQGLEGNILVPKVMDQSVGVNAIVSLLAIAAFGALFGVAGAILAIPLAAMLQILLSRILFNTPIGQDPATPLAAGPTSTGTTSRSRIGVLRLEAQEVIQDLHKSYARASAEPDQPEIENAEDRLETIAIELDAILTTLEADPETGTQSDASSTAPTQNPTGQAQQSPTPPASQEPGA